MLCELVGSTIASLTLKWIFDGEDTEVMLTQPVGPNPASDLKVVVLEIIITFIYVMTNSSARADPRAVESLFFYGQLEINSDYIMINYSTRADPRTAQSHFFNGQLEFNSDFISCSITSLFCFS